MQKLIRKWPFLALVAAVQLACWPVTATWTETPWLAWAGLILLTGWAIGPLLNPDKHLKEMLKTPWITGAIGLAWVAVTASSGLELGLVCGLALGFTVLVLRECGVGWGALNTWSITVFSSALVWQMSAAGELLVAWSLLVFGLVALLSSPRLSDWFTIVISVLLGVLAVGQPLFVWLPLLVAGSMVAVWPRRAMMVAVFGNFMCGITMTYLGSSVAWPTWPFTLDAAVAAGIFLAIVLILMAYNWRWWSPVWQLAWGLGAVALVVDMAEIGHNPHYYWLAAMPTVVFALLGRLGHENRVKYL